MYSKIWEKYLLMVAKMSFVFLGWYENDNYKGEKILIDE